MRGRNARRRVASVAAGLGAACALSASAIDISFNEVAAQAGVAYSGESFGQSWGDFNADGFADLYVSNHGTLPTLFRNVNGMGFIDDTGQITGDFGGDTHGAAWADFDNDGDRDLLTLVGAASGTGDRPNRFLLNNGGSFIEAAVAFGLDYPSGRGRTPLWFDWNLDGELDAFLSNWVRNDGLGDTALFTRTGSIFVDDSALTGINTLRSDDFATLIMTPLSSTPQLLVVSSFPFPDRVYNFATVPFANTVQTLGLPSINNVQDVAVADFDGDLQQELYLARVLNPSQVSLVSATELRASLNGVSASEIGIRFAANGPVTFNLGPDYRVAPADIRIGIAGVSPESYIFELDPLDPDLDGTPVHELTENLIYVYYDSQSATWAVDVTNALRPRLIATAAGGLSSPVAVNFTSLPGTRSDVLLRYNGSEYVDIAAQAGVSAASSCESVAVADFDNDMDLDIYRACRGMAVNAANQLLENDGSGNFTLVPDAAGASGTMLGRSDVVTAADYNNDGFIDLFVSNGRGDPPLADGPSELFENQGNDNHWLAIELQGTLSSRDGIGTWAVLEAGGVAQSRLQSNGVKRYGQDDQRLHFGLGANTTVDTLTLSWPSGAVQVLQDIAADQVLTVVEPLPLTDSDGDGVANEMDNCSAAANPDQLDADADGLGNLCDADFNGDCATNAIDLGLFKAGFFGTDAVLDLNGDGVVNPLDLGVLKGLYFQPPGPSGVSNLCEP